MTENIAILDTSALMSLYALGLLPHLKLFYDRVLVPRKVEEEFLLRYPDSSISSSTRFDFLENFYEEQDSWFQRCLEYGSDLIALYKTEKGIDDGEAEVFAQNQTWESRCCLILDDRKARSFADRKNFAKCGILLLLAKMDITWQLCSYFKAIETLREKRNARISDELAADIYQKVRLNLL